MFIIGGKALPDGEGEQMALADIFQFHPETNCWVQVTSLSQTISSTKGSSRDSQSLCVQGATAGNQQGSHA